VLPCRPGALDSRTSISRATLLRIDNPDRLFLTPAGTSNPAIRQALPDCPSYVSYDLTTRFLAQRFVAEQSIEQ
jgi:hypothetical protein